MPATNQLTAAIDAWLIHAEDSQRSDHTLAAQRYAMTLFEQWLDTRPQPIDLEAVTAALLVSYVNDIKTRARTPVRRMASRHG